jgi:hypothetical protein
MLLIRHFSHADQEALAVPGDFDAAVINAEVAPGSIQRLLSAGKGVICYFGVNSVQPEAIRGEWRTPWFSFLADTVMTEWGAYLVPTPGDTAFYKYYGGTRYMINWAVIGPERALRFAQAQKRIAGPQTALFWDVYFPTLAPWMFAAHGAQYEDIPIATRTAYRDNLLGALTIARKVMRANSPGRRVPWSVIVNGDWNAPPPVFLEGVEQSPLGSFEEAMTVWRRNNYNVASIRAQYPEWVDTLLGRWTQYGGTISFTGDSPTSVNAAYTAADALRRQ